MALNFTRKQKIILGVIVVLTVLIPTGSFVISQSFNKKPEKPFDISSNFPATSPMEVPKDDPFSRLRGEIDDVTASPNPINVQASSSESATLLLSPSLSFKINLEGRPVSNQAARVFLGIASGSATNNPKYLLSFLINVPESGVYKDLNLAGLEQGNTYTAYLKGPSQIATSSTFVAKTAPTDIGILSMLTGDINDDNVINTNDSNILKAALGAVLGSAKWSANLDFNLDQRINSLDLSLVTKNINKIGSSGPWMSGIPPASKSASLSGSLNPDTGGPDNTPKDGTGYWIWVPTEF